MYNLPVFAAPPAMSPVFISAPHQGHQARWTGVFGATAAYPPLVAWMEKWRLMVHVGIA